MIAPDCVWDLGANTGVYSRLAADVCSRVVSFDIDPACVERNYREIKKEKEQRILPQLLDLVNPSPALGWAHDERASLAQRAEADVVLALALIHHIAISNNVPLAKVAAYLAELAPNLVIEFVPKSDPKVKTLLATREDIFPSYTREGFEAAFQEHFEIVKATDIAGSERTLYRMRRRT
jgi:ribosomal protein L11 methylase PrmA